MGVTVSDSGLCCRVRLMPTECLIKPQFVDFIVSKAARFSSVAECEITGCEIAYVGLKE